LCATDASRGRAVADCFGVPDVHSDFRELCSRRDIDAITIATPNAVHAQQALCALEHGKHVLCEKPLAMTATEAREMADAAANSGKVHQVAFTFRYGFALRELRNRVRAGDIGSPHYLRVQYDGWNGLRDDWKIGWRENQALAGGGILYDLGVHLFDAARFVLGPVDVVTGFVQNLPRLRSHASSNQLVPVETDDIAGSLFRHKNGVRGQWFISRVTPPFAENGYLEVIGSEGALKASLSRGKIDALKASRPARPAWEDLPLPARAGDGQPHSLSIMMHSFVDACVRGSISNECDASFQDGLATQEAIEAVLRADEQLTWVHI
jgi:predicted dehydrogenase